jgi:type I restriction enzyme, S subunit
MKNGIDLPKNWRRVRLGEILAVSSGKGIRVNGLKGGEYPVYGGNGLNGYHSEYSLEEPRLIIGRVGVKCGVTHITKAKSWVTDNALIVEPKNDAFDLKFMQLKLQYENLNKLSVSTAQPVISGGKIYAYEIVLPPKEVQQQIVFKIEELFSELDKGIEDLRTVQQQLKVYRQAVSKWAFENDLENRSEKLLSEVSDKIQIGPFGTQLHKEDYIEGGIPLINPMHIQDGQIVADSSYSIKEEKRDSLPNYILKKGDVIMGRRGEMGRCGLVTEKEQGWFCGTGSLYVRPNTKVASPKFLYHLLKSQPIKKYLEENAGGTTMANLNLKIVNNIPFHLPTLEEQQHIVQEIESRLNVCDKIEESITNSLKQAEALRQSILKRAFEGNII